MITYIKYPILKGFHQKLKTPIYTLCDKIEKSKNHIIVFPKTTETEKCIVYPKENKVGFYCKSLKPSKIVYFKGVKGGLAIERDSKQEMQKIGREWYFDNNIKLPRKAKKKLIGKC